MNRIEAGEDALIERIRNEGARSPADVLVTVDAGRLWRAEQLGLFQPVKSALLEARIPQSFREPGGLWFGFSLRARVIAYNKAKVQAGELKNYEDLADAEMEGPRLHALLEQRLQPVADGRPDRPPGRGQGRGLGQVGAGTTSRASPRAATPTS